MGASASQLGTPTNQTVPVITTSLQRNPVQDGASGLHYSGRIYVNPPPQLGGGVCDNYGSVGPDQVNDVMPGSISSTSLPMDDSTHRISQTALQSYVQGLIQAGNIPPSLPIGPEDMDRQMAADTAFYQSVQTEYCFYEARYRVALDSFLQMAANPNIGSSTDAALNATVALNARLNSLLEIVNFVANDRAQKVNQRSPDINTANASLQEKLSILRAQQEFLTSSDARIRTQEEMVRFSAEKSHAMNIQIAFFVALNVVALGTILAVYKSVRA